MNDPSPRTLSTRFTCSLVSVDDGPVPYMRAAPAGGVTDRGGWPTLLNSRPRVLAHVYGQNDAAEIAIGTPALRHTFVNHQLHQE